jgi:hypothetical protein
LKGGWAHPKRLWADSGAFEDDGFDLVNELEVFVPG